VPDAVDHVRQQGFDLVDRFHADGDPGHLAAAAEHFQHAADLAPLGDWRKGRDLMYVCTVLRMFYDQARQLWALDEAAVAGRAALSVERDPAAYHDVLVRLGICLYVRFQVTRERGDLDESLKLLRAAAGTAAPARPESFASLYHLALALDLAHDARRDLAFLDEAVAAGRVAAQNPNPLQFSALCQLVRHLRELSWARGDLTLLQEAEAAARWGVEITASATASDRAACLYELSQTLEALGRRTDRLNYLQEAAALADDAAGWTPDPAEQSLRAFISDQIARNLQEKRAAGGPTEQDGGQPPGGDPPPPPDFTA
jgi:hypothetical protein